MEPFVKRVETNGVETFRLKSWEERFSPLSVGFTSRIGGVSEGHFDSFNCALHVADRPEYVIENRRRLADAAGFPFDSWTCAEQVHDDQVAIVTRKDRGRGRENRETAFAHHDALVTDEPDIMLVSFYADCVPLYYYDPDHQAVGLAHAGWKGTAKQIAARTVQTMQATYGSEPQNIRVAIGPSIGACCYEVDHKVIHAMLEQGIHEGWQEKSDGRFMLDLKEINRHILIKEGILPSHIEVTTLCTSCLVESFYSHRRDQGRTGRMASWIGLREVTSS